MKVVLFGANGYAGTAISAELLSRGHEVIGVTRSTDKPVLDGVSHVTGSLHDADFLNEVASTANAIIVAIPGRPLDGVRLLDAIPALLEACGTHEVRLGIVGGAGSLHVVEGGPRLVDTPDFPEAFKAEVMGQVNVLEALRETTTTVDWFYVSPAAAFGAHAPGERTGSYRLGGEALVVDAGGESRISGADFAVAFVDELETPNHHQRRFTVGY
ncbi:MAG: NAD-dependent epimerase/dehydratase [Glaciihabitans sp.]|nr:NAD-dependent epimerase/dehydratase [Glaciihabitans sp.]